MALACVRPPPLCHPAQHILGGFPLPPRVGLASPRLGAQTGEAKRCVKGTPHTSLAPDDSHGTGSAEPRTTPLAPALVYAPTVRASPTPGPTHASGAHELGGPRQEGQGVTATWETWRPFLVPPHPHLRTGCAQSRAPFLCAHRPRATREPGEGDAEAKQWRPLSRSHRGVTRTPGTRLRTTPRAVSRARPLRVPPFGCRAALSRMCTIKAGNYVLINVALSGLNIIS